MNEREAKKKIKESLEELVEQLTQEYKVEKPKIKYTPARWAFYHPLTKEIRIGRYTTLMAELYVKAAKTNDTNLMQEYVTKIAKDLVHFILHEFRHHLQYLENPRLNWRQVFEMNIPYSKRKCEQDANNFSKQNLDRYYKLFTEALERRGLKL
jgi:hypothetical protein